MKQRQFGNDPSNFPLLVPIMVGNTSATTEKALGKLLAPYLADPTTAFVISSDFAHWGSRFRYTYYRPTPGGAGQMLSASAKVKDRAIHESIKEVDFECMGACESGSHEKWLDVLEGNCSFSTAVTSLYCFLRADLVLQIRETRYAVVILSVSLCLLSRSFAQVARVYIKGLASSAS